MPHYTETQLREVEGNQLIKIILMLQVENDRLRAELEKLRMRQQISDKKGEQVSQLKVSIKKNQVNMD